MDSHREDYVSVHSDRPATARDPLLPRPSPHSVPFPNGGAPSHDDVHPADARAPPRLHDDPAPPFRPLHLLLGLNICLAVGAVLGYMLRDTTTYYFYHHRARFSYAAIVVCSVSALADFVCLAALCRWEKALKRVPLGKKLVPIVKSESAHAVLAIALAVGGLVAAIGWGARNHEVVPIVFTYVCAYVYIRPQNPWDEGRVDRC